MTGPFLAASGLTPRCHACSVILTGKSDRCPHCGAAQGAAERPPGAAGRTAQANGSSGHPGGPRTAGQLIGQLTEHLQLGGPRVGERGDTGAHAADYAAATASGDFAGAASAAGLRRSAWGPSSSAALSLFVFVLVFALAVMLGRSRLGRDDGQIVAAVQTPAAQLTPISTRLPPPGAAPQIAPLRGTPPQPAPDTALVRARACRAVEAWDCVRDAARDVVARDPGNREAQALLERAIAQSGWQRSGNPADARADATGAAAPVMAPVMAPVVVQPTDAGKPAGDSASGASSLNAVLLSGASDEAKQHAISSMGWNTAAAAAAPAAAATPAH